MYNWCKNDGCIEKSHQTTNKSYLLLYSQAFEEYLYKELHRLQMWMVGPGRTADPAPERADSSSSQMSLQRSRAVRSRGSTASLYQFQSSQSRYVAGGTKKIRKTSLGNRTRTIAITVQCSCEYTASCPGSLTTGWACNL